MSSADETDIQDAVVRKGSHYALEIVDIIDQILLKLMEGPKAKKADLVSMARSCKAFEDPSLNRLWASMSSVVPLLKLIHGVEEFQGSLIIAGKIDFKELPPRFHSYANRIRDVNYEVTGDFGQIDPSTWMRLAHLDSALLPNLRSFGLSYTNPSTLGRERSLLLLPALIRPGSITSFTFKTSSVVSYNQRYDLGPILTLLGDYDLGMEVLVAAGTINSRYADILANMRTLQSVSIELALDSNIPYILRSLSFLPRLSKLCLVFLGATPDPGQLTSQSFPELLEVVLKGKVAFITRTLAAMKAPVLNCVDVQVMPGAGDGTQELVFPSLQLPRFPTLKRILVDLTGCSSSSRHGERDNKLSFITPMLGAQHVEELVVKSLEPSMCLSDYEIIELAAAWPFLKVLRLEHTSLPAMQPSFTSLDHLGRRCSRLVELSINLREHQSYSPNTSLKRSSALRELNLQHTQIKRYASAARYIDGLFPFLRTFSMAESQACNNMRDIIFEACQAVRKDGRERTAAEIAMMDFDGERGSGKAYPDDFKPGSSRKGPGLPLPAGRKLKGKVRKE